MTLRRAALALSAAIAVPLLAAQQQPEVVVLEREEGILTSLPAHKNMSIVWHWRQANMPA